MSTFGTPDLEAQASESRKRLTQALMAANSGGPLGGESLGIPAALSQPQPKQFTLPGPSSGDLQKQADAIPPTGVQPATDWKSALMQAITKTLPVALTAHFAGTAAGAGAGQGMMQAQQTQAADMLKRRTELLGQATQQRGAEEHAREFDLGQQEKNRDFQLEAPLKQAQKRYYDAGTNERNAKPGPDLNHLYAEAVQSGDTAGAAKYADAIQQIQKPTNPPAEPSPDKQAFDELKKGPAGPATKAYRTLHPEKPQQEPGSWSLQQDKDGNFILFNSKTTETRPAPANMVPKGTGQVTPATQKILQETTPVHDQVKQLLQDLEPYKDDNTRGKLAYERLQYATGKASPEGALGNDISKLALDRVMAGARVLKGSSRAYQALQMAMQHAPNTWIDSPQLMYGKLQTIEQNLSDIESDAVKYGTKGQRTSDVQGAGSGKDFNAPSGKDFNAPLSIDEARQYLQKAGGDKNKARALAKAAGRTF